MMNPGFAILAAAAFGVASASLAQAQDRQPSEASDRANAPRGTPLLGGVRPLAPEENAAPALGASVLHVLSSTILLQGNANIKMPKGKTRYDFGSVTFITCPVAACTLEIEAMVQAGQNKTVGNLWDICFDIDGKSTLLTCPYQGTLPTNGGYVVGHFAWSAPLKKGMHTVQPTSYVTAPAGLANYHLAYRLYKP
jgi:hypothetical protein